MQTNYQYFLVVAETLNITKAAQKLFISQQSLSEHIRKLEEKYNTKLFTRTPRLALTDSGEALVQALNEIQVIENSLADTISDSSHLQQGKICIGCNYNRATFMIPEIFPAFHEQYPNVRWELRTGNTKKMEPLLQNGELDFFIGINLRRSEHYTYHLLEEESIFLIASDHVLNRLGYNSDTIRDFYRNGIFLEQFWQVPFVINSRRETLRTVFDDLTIAYASHFDVPLEIDNPQSRAILCAKDFCVTIMTQSMLPFVQNIKPLDRDNHLHIFPLRNNTIYNYNSVIAHHKKLRLSPYKKYFMDLVIDYYSNTLKYDANNSIHK